MPELCSFLCLKLFSLNLAFVHAQKDCFAYQNGHTRVALKHKKIDLPLETSLEINI